VTTGGGPVPARDRFDRHHFDEYGQVNKCLEASGVERGVIVIGAGRMGVQIGIEYAMAGFLVRLVARDMGSLEARFNHAIKEWAELLPLDKPALSRATGRTRLSNGAEQVDGGIEVIVESLPEDLDIKASALRPLVIAHPEAVVATNTSSLDIGLLGEAIGAPTRVIGVHYLNPPYLNSLVEVVTGAATSSDTTEHMLGIIAELGKRPILIRRALPGFAWNRLQFALLREAVHLVESGVVTASEIDLIMQFGLGRRWRAVGPLKSVVLGGVDTFVSAAPRILESLSDRNDLDGLRAISEQMDFDSVATIRARDRLLAEDLLPGRMDPPCDA
jgi:3-hydroxybutyryl-CoA dehydrogenase